MNAPAIDTVSRSKIVIGVDDAPENLLLLKAVLSTAGYPFFGAASGTEALSLVLRVQPSLILLDIQMPELDGFTTCARLRALADLRSVPIAFLTARKSREDVQAGLAVGGNDFIVKPFDTVRLLERVRLWVTRRVDQPRPAANG